MLKPQFSRLLPIHLITPPSLITSCTQLENCNTGRRLILAKNAGLRRVQSKICLATELGQLDNSRRLEMPNLVQYASFANSEIPILVQFEKVENLLVTQLWPSNVRHFRMHHATSFDEPRIVCSDRKKQTDDNLTSYVVWSAAFVALSGFWPYGFSIGAINSGYEVITESFRETYQERLGANVSEELVNGVYVASSGIYPLGGIVGSLIVRTVVCKFGRLRGLLLGHAATVLFSVILGVSKISGSPELIIFGRFGIGVTSGLVSTGISVMYIAEISPKRYRGALGGLESVAIAIAMVAGDALGLPQALGSSVLWPLLLSLTGVFSLIFILVYWKLPDSPRELYIDEGRKDEAEELLRKLRGTGDVCDAVLELEEETNFSALSKRTLTQVLLSKSLRPSLIAAVVLSSAYQLTGVSGVSTNLGRIFSISGLNDYDTRLATIAVFSSMILVRAAMIYFVEKCGRKPLLVICYGAQTVFLVMLAISMEVQDEANVASYVSIVASAGYMIGFSIGAGPVTLILVAEIFDQSCRPAALSIATAIYWLGFLITTVVTPYMLLATGLRDWEYQSTSYGLQEGLGGYTFVPYSVISFLTLLFVIYKVPETKNKTFKEIQLLFQRRFNDLPANSLRQSSFIIHSD